MFQLSGSNELTAIAFKFSLYLNMIGLRGASKWTADYQFVAILAAMRLCFLFAQRSCYQ